MLIQFEHDSKTIKIDSEQFHDISIAIRKQENVNCYHLDDPEFSYFESEAFSGSLDKGGSVNCEKISLYPHASGTHTECALHVVKAGFDMRHLKIPMLQMAQLVTVDPEQIEGDQVISLKCIESLEINSDFKAIIFRTKPNTDEKLKTNYSGHNPIYFAPDVLIKLKSMGFNHLICDIPSIDKESDGGALTGHKNWFLSDGQPDPKQTITELVYIPNSIPDATYALGMQVPSIETDAVPSRILIYPCH